MYSPPQPAHATTQIASPESESLHWAQAFELWIESQRSDNTRRAYRNAWDALLTFTGHMPWELSRTDLARWCDYQRSVGLSPATVHQRLAAISSFYTYASQVYTRQGINGQEQPLAMINPAAAIQRPRLPAFQQARYLTIPEARALLGGIPRYTLQGKRDYALYLAYLVTGRRNSEIRTLRWSDIELNRTDSLGVERVYYRWEGKGQVRRDECPLPVWEAIRSYLEAAGKLGRMRRGDYIFTPILDRAAHLPNIRPGDLAENRPLSMRAVGQLLKKYARRAGLEAGRVHVHTLRHTAAMLRRQAGDDIEQISAFLGHSSLAVTQVYLHTLEGQRDTSWEKVSALLGLSP